MSSCTLCNANSPEPWNAPLIESSNFSVLPSLGALVEGWVLLVPRQHFLSVGAIPESLLREMDSLKETVRDFLETRYGAVSMFEHGPGAKQRKVGCGVDHAHLHMIPAAFDLAKAVEPYLPSGAEWATAKPTSCRDAAQSGEDYLYLEQPMGRARIIRDPNIGSQLFRRAVADILGAPTTFDWRTNPQIENVSRTIQVFSAGGWSCSPLLNSSQEAA